MKKKILSLFAAAILAVSVNAADYTHSIGMVAGLGLGAQYKTMVSENFTLIDEFGYFTCISGAASQSKAGAYAGAINNLVLAYQGNITEGEGISLDYYAGGQIKVGYIQNRWASDAAGIFGFGAAVGIEAIMQNAPIAFSFDFRPGYALGMYGATTMAGYPLTLLDHMFDYSFNLGVRYKF